MAKVILWQVACPGRVETTYVDGVVRAVCIAPSALGASASAGADLSLEAKPSGVPNSIPVSGLPSSLTYMENGAHLAAARAHGFRAFVALTGPRSSYADAQGNFDLALWKEALDSNDLAALRPYVDDGTIVGLQAIDEPHEWETGRGPTMAELNEICRYAHDRLPGIACGFNAPPAWLELGADELVDLDFIFTQTDLAYTSDWAAWAREQLVAAEWYGGPVYLGVNADRGASGDDQLLAVAGTLCASRAAGVVVWDWPQVQERIGALAAGAEGRSPAVSPEPRLPPPGLASAAAVLPETPSLPFEPSAAEPRLPKPPDLPTTEASVPEPPEPPIVQVPLPESPEPPITEVALPESSEPAITQAPPPEPPPLSPPPLPPAPLPRRPEPPPAYPYGMVYASPKARWTEADRGEIRAHLERLQGLGVRTVIQTFSSHLIGTGRESDWRIFLDEAGELGMRVVARLQPIEVWDGKSFDLGPTHHFLAAVEDHPALLAYLGLEEPLEQFDSDQLREYYSGLKALVPDVPIAHLLGDPAYFDHNPRWPNRELGPGMCDICIIWYYPARYVSGRPILEEGVLRKTLRANRKLVDAQAPDAELWFLGQAFAYLAHPRQLRMPTPAEMQTIFQMADREAMDGFLWYLWVHDQFDQILSDPELEPQQLAVLQIYEQYVSPRVRA